jgi:hypothetical protein
MNARCRGPACPWIVIRPLQEATCAQIWVVDRPDRTEDTQPTQLPQLQPATEADGAAAAAGGGQQWHFLVDGALSYGCSSIRDAPDAHFKFHAACVLCFCVSKVLDSWQQQQQQQQQGQEKPQQHEQRHQQGQEQEQVGGVRWVAPGKPAHPLTSRPGRGKRP